MTFGLSGVLAAALLRQRCVVHCHHGIDKACLLPRHIRVTCGIGHQHRQVPVQKQSRRSYVTDSSPRNPSPATQSSPPPNAAAAAAAGEENSAPPKKRQFAILGGGITGLTAAHYLARYAPDAHITLYEASRRLGGWIDGEKVPARALGEGGQIEEVGQVQFQSGPRMLRTGASAMRYDDIVLYDVLANLDLEKEIVFPSKDVPKSRYVYYPDRLVALPSGGESLSQIGQIAWSVLTEPVFEGWFNAASRYLQKKGDPYITERKDLPHRDAKEGEEGSLQKIPAPITPPHLLVEEDESAGEFLTRILGSKALVDNLASAMFHGIYGGDIWELSAKQTIVADMWYRMRWSPLPSMSDAKSKVTWVKRNDWFLMHDLGLVGPNKESIARMAQRASSESTLAFRDGLFTLVDALVADLSRRDNVTIKMGTPATALKYEDDQVLVSSPGNSDPAPYDQVLSTILASQLATIAPPDTLPSLSAIRSVTIMVVNLWYPDPTLLSRNRGFGYLIPSSVDRTAQNPEDALGVLFDSDTQPLSTSEPPGTKLTVMLGGHYWADRSPNQFPDNASALQMARSVVARHLKIPEPLPPGAASATLCRECLPQHTVGHRSRLAKAHEELRAAFGGRLSVAGPSYTNIGVLPAMRAGYDTGMWIAHHAVAKGMDVEAGRKKRVKEGPPPYFAKRDMMKPMRRKRGESLFDPVGDTGLLEFGRTEAEGLGAVRKGAMRFRSWTDKELR